MLQTPICGAALNTGPRNQRGGHEPGQTPGHRRLLRQTLSSERRENAARDIVCHPPAPTNRSRASIADSLWHEPDAQGKQRALGPTETLSRVAALPGLIAHLKVRLITASVPRELAAAVRSSIGAAVILDSG